MLHATISLIDNESARARSFRMQDRPQLKRCPTRCASAFRERLCEIRALRARGADPRPSGAALRRGCGGPHHAQQSWPFENEIHGLAVRVEFIGSNECECGLWLQDPHDAYRGLQSLPVKW
jgi:hypothetical protein